MLLDAAKFAYFRVSNSLFDSETLNMDPVCAVFALAMANRYPVGSKPSFSNYEICYDDGRDLVKQAASREAKQVGRDDMGLLTDSITLAIQFWGQNNDFVYMMEEACKGIKTIAATYGVVLEPSSSHKDTSILKPVLTLFKKLLEEAIANQTQLADNALSPHNQQIKALWKDTFITAVRRTYDEPTQLEAFKTQLKTQQEAYRTLMGRQARHAAQAAFVGAPYTSPPSAAHPQ